MMMMSHNIKSNIFSFYSFQLIFILIFLNINISYSLINDNNEYLGSTGKHLFHFVQVTDIHITHIGYKDRIEQFEQFCNDIIKNLVKPKVTVVTGDLVNSVSVSIYQHEKILGTGQYENEWKIYGNILNRTNVTKYTKWLDIKGNHDAFMDSDPDSSKSFYRKYSHQGHDHSGSYEYTLQTKDGDSYSFISIDMCPRPGLGRPFNFFGYLNKNEENLLKKLSEKTKNSTSIIYFGHYPLSFTYSYGLNKIMKYGIVYLNGHLHSGIKHLYARHSNGLLELELGDWKRRRRFRIVTIDGGLLSFEDFRYNQSIFGVISNPKSAKFHTPREPFYRLNQSTHIRIIIFSKFLIINITVLIDGKYIGRPIQSIDNENLYVLPWNTSLYNDENLHQIFVEIKDKENNTITIEHEFSLSLSMVTKWNKSKIVLTMHQPTFGFILLISSLCLYIFILLYYHYQSKQNQCHKTTHFQLWNRFRLQMIIFCSNDLMFYSFICFGFYHFIGPWYIGYLTEGYLGATFLWGTLIKGVYLPPDTQIFIGFVQFYFFVFPLLISLSSSCYYRYNQLNNRIKSNFNRCFQIYSVYILFIYSICFVLFWSFVMTSSYKLAWILSPFGLILPIFSIILYIKSHCFKLEDFKIKFSMKINERINSINEDNSELLEKVNQQSSDIHFIKSQ